MKEVDKNNCLLNGAKRAEEGGGEGVQSHSRLSTN